MLKSTVVILLTNILGLSILSIIVNMVLPNGNFKKYARFMVNIVMLAVILKSFLNTNDAILLDQRMLRNSTWTDIKDLEIKSQEIDKARDQQIEEMFKREVENQIKEQIKNMVESKDIVVSVELEKRDNETYSIRDIYIRLKETGRGNADIEVMAGQHKYNRKDIVEYLSNLYHVPKENITIEMHS